MDTVFSNLILRQISQHDRWFTIGCLMGCFWIGFMPSGAAQVTLDGTTSTTISGDCQDSCIISGQDQAGGNLFHSFQDFSIDEGNQITFTHGSGIDHIFSRVTGDNQSSILGTLAIEGSADFFLLNPNGIIFGPDATLDMRGSFIGTTASSILFDDGIEFSADATSAPLLTVSTPVGLQFGTTVGSIENQSQSSLNGGLNAQGTPTGLQVDAGQRLALVGGALSLTEGNVTASGGRIDLVSVGANEQVLLIEDEQGLIPQPDLSAALGDIVIQQSAMDVSGPVSGSEGGSVALWGDTIFLEDSDIRAETTASQDGGTLWIQANELTLSNSGIQSITFSDATGADVELMIGTLSLSDGSVIAAETDNGGQSGHLTINADRIGLFSSDIGTETRGAGNAGNVTIETGLLGAVDSGILANAFGSGDGGSIRLRATDFVELVGNSVITAAVDLSEVAEPSTVQGGTAGDIAIATNRLTLRDLAQIATDSFGNAGAAGDISITATDIELLGTPLEESPVGLFSQVDFGSSGQGGSIDLTTETLLMQDGAQIGVSTLGSGPAGNISIQASDWINITGDTSTGIFAQVESDATGPGGRVTVNTPQLQLVGSGARLSATTLGQGQGGNVDVQAQSLVMEEGAQIQAATLGFAPGGILTVNTTSTVLRGADASGEVSTALVTSTLGDEPAGDLTVQTETLRIEDGARISASTSGGGTGGNLVVQASGEVEVIGSAASNQQRPSGLFVEASGTGASGNLSLLAGSLLLNQQATISAEATSEDGGNIQLHVDELISLRRNSSISATAGLASGAGDGGNITIETPFLIALPAENSDITANAFEGQGGNIHITAQNIVGLQPRPTLTPLSDITASSEFGIDGTIVIESPDVEPEEGLVDLPANVVDVTRLIAQGCSPNTDYAYSEFSLTGRGGVPTNPAGLLSSHTLLNDLGLPFDQTTATSTLEALGPSVDSPTDEDVRSTTQPPITEAKEWRITPQGQVVLTSDASRLISNPLWYPQTDCSQS